MLKDQGVPCSPENGQDEKNATTWVLDFPVSTRRMFNKKDVSADGTNKVIIKTYNLIGVNTMLV